MAEDVCDLVVVAVSGRGVFVPDANSVTYRSAGGLMFTLAYQGDNAPRCGDRYRMMLERL